MEKIQVKNLGYEEYWAAEHKCPFCGNRDMHMGKNFCAMCGENFNKVKFL